jgi:GDP-4-dehydro-6-deoxy-D-mannose reductase
MKAIVTGAGGFAGRHLVALLRETGWAVVSIARRAPADRVGDLERMPLRGLAADVVFHLAAFANPAASAEAAAETFRANVGLTSRVLREIRAGRFVFPSTCQVYAPSPRPLAETALLRPASPYAASKLCAEALARGAVILRPFNHTGPGQSEAYVCPRIARAVARAEAGRGPRMLELGELRHRRDLFDVRDMARAYLLAAERGIPGEVYNAGTGRPVAIREVVDHFLSRARVAFRVRSRREVPTVLSADPAKFQAATGWAPRIPLRRTLDDLLAHERRRVSSE